jgi:hypothetical protein
VDLAHHDSISEDSAGVAGIVYFTSQNGTGPTAMSLVTPAIPSEMEFPDPDDAWSLSILSDTGGILTEALIRPPDKPPRI